MGFLGNASPQGQSASVAAFRQGLRELGWIERRNLVIEFRWVEGELSRQAARLEADGVSKAVKPNKLIDTRISTPLFNLPLGTIASGEPPTSLPQRNLLRQVTWSLPSGQSIARLMQVPALGASEFPELRSFGLGLDGSTPLRYYVLREAHVMAGGQHLGPVGGRIVGEVFLGLLELDDDSYLATNERWRPTLPTRSGRVSGDFRMVDFLTVAGVDPGHRGQ